MCLFNYARFVFIIESANTKKDNYSIILFAQQAEFLLAKRNAQIRVRMACTDDVPHAPTGTRLLYIRTPLYSTKPSSSPVQV